jgi:hypothetical protein
VLEVVDTGGWCASKLGMGPEYPGLVDSNPIRGPWSPLERYATWHD